jgi:hypothetical protein
MNELLFHHCTNLSTVRYDTIIPSERYTLNDNHIHGCLDDKDFWDWDINANNWLKNETGFYPLFMGVGSSLDDLYVTGYADNWRTTLSSWFDKEKNKMCYTRRKKGEFPNYVLFSFKNTDCVFLDCDWWITTAYGYAAEGRFETTSQERRYIFKYSWNRSKWLRKAANEPGRVICVVPKLDLRQADRIWTRNQKTKKTLEKMGFKNVFAKRIPVDDF